MIRLSDQYDWVVLGDHPGALLSASLAAKLGLSVLVLPLETGLNLKVSRSGPCLDQESNFVVGMSGSDRAPGLVFECLNRLGMLPSESEMIRHSEAMPQVITPRTRICFVSEDGGLEKELLRELGRDLSVEFGLQEALKESSGEFNSFWLGLPRRLSVISGKVRSGAGPSSLRDLRRSLGRSHGVSSRAVQAWLESGRQVSELAEAIGRPDLAETCLGVWYALTANVADDLDLGDILHLAALGRTGASFRGGLTAYREFLLRLARRNGAHVPVKSECRRVFIDDGRFIGVQIASRGNMISARGGILGCPLSIARGNLAVSGRGFLSRLKQSPAPVGWRFTLALTVCADALPPGMSSRTVWKETGAPVLEIEVQDQTTLFVRTILPFTQESLSPSYQRRIAARMIRQLEEILPFVERHVIRMYPDFRVAGVSEHDELSEIYGFASPEMIPGNLRCYSGKGVGSSTGYEGLFLASAESFPDLGGFGGVVAGIEGVAWLAHRSGVAGPFA